MNNPPFFTIITASLNNWTTIEKTLASIRSQTFQDFEHIVIDGGSRDDTAPLLDAFSRKYNLAWISEPDEGIADALNKGLRRARGTYILVLQADDYLLEPDTLQKVHSIAQDETFDMYSFPVFMDIPGRGNVLIKPIRACWWIRFKTILRHQGCFVHRRVYEKTGNYSPLFSIAMDYDFFYRSLQAGCTVKFAELPVAIMGGKGISSNKKLLRRRLEEEGRVQQKNERNPLWRFAQMLFRVLYVPFKTGGRTA